MRFVLSLLLLCLAYFGYSQCDPIVLCAETAVTDSLYEGEAAAFDCYDAQNSSYFLFTTNSSSQNTGDLLLSFENVTIPDTLGDQELQVVVIELATTTISACDPSIWGASIICTTISDDIGLTVPESSLIPESTYLVLVGNNDIPLNSPPSFNITTSGMWVNLDVCCNQEIIQGEEGVVTALGSNTPLIWSSDTDYPLVETDNQISVYPLETTIVNVIGEVAGCVLSNEVTISVVQPVFAFTLFTPNNDGVNDKFEIANIEKYDNAIVTIFDRWGQQLYKSIGYTNAWDGTNNGRKIPAGTYYYVIEFNSLKVDIPPISGYTTIIY